MHTVVLEHERVREVHGLAEHDALVRPGAEVRAPRDADLALGARDVVQLEEEPPRAVLPREERVGDEGGAHVGDVLAADEGLRDAGHGAQREGRRALVQSDRPEVLVASFGRLRRGWRGAEAEPAREAAEPCARVHRSPSESPRVTCQASCDA
ncbi:MAG: hypothetical protein HY275_16560 [Gemmatimonadetes bacterium]|nr:hypothetical protein [Gemmatimonadota bacterium]